MSINTTANTAGTTKLNKTFYDRQLLESAKTRFVHAKYGQKRPIPKNSGKRVEFRKWNLFDANDAMEALQEGVTPASQALSQSNVEVEVAQYGAYVEVSDLLDMTGYDQVISESAELLGEQLGTVVEWVTRDAMNAGTNVQYANGKSGRGEITAADKLTVAEIRKAVRTLKKAKARPFGDEGRKPHFICICSPEATYDLQSDSLWQDVSKYSCAEQIYSGEIGRLFAEHFRSIAPRSVRVDVEVLHGGFPYVCPTDLPAYRAAARAVERTFGRKPLPYYSGGSIPIISTFEKELGVKSVLLGFGLDRDAIHSPNESYGLENFLRGIETIVWFYREFAAGR